MSRYTVETGIPIPPPRVLKSCQDRRGPQTEWTRVLEHLNPGESVLTDDYTEFKSADGYRQRKPERKYMIRKIPGQGWRVWRTE